MIIINNLTRSIDAENCVVALGNFDGVHKGHQELLKKAVSIATENNVKSIVLTFRQLPVNVISGRHLVPAIMNEKQKAAAVERTGIDIFLCIDFDESMRKMSAQDFVFEILSGKLHCGTVVCGFNYSFGFMGRGTPDQLKEYGKLYNFNTYVLPDYKINRISVSSTLLRSFLSEGNLIKFAEYSGKNYTIEGTVVHGRHIGTELGFPTANIDKSEILLKNGVYACFALYKEQKYKAVANIGNKPTVGNCTRNIEVHIINFSGVLYEQNISIEFISFIRDERKFSDFNQLRDQIKKDVHDAEKLCIF